MNTQAIIDRLLASDGIIAVLMHGEFKTKQANPDDAICKLVLEHARSIAGTVCEDIRVVVGIYTITVAYDPEATVVVALPTGHSVAKSLKRMIRRATKSTRTGTPRPRVNKPAEDPEVAISKALRDMNSPTAVERIPAPANPAEPNPTTAVGGVREW